MHIPQLRGTVRETWILAGLHCILAYSFYRAATHALIADETFHIDQILRYVRGDAEMNPFITQIPGYHAVIAFFAKMTGRESVAALRFFSFLWSALCVVIFYLTARTTDGKTAPLRTAQWAFLPILFPYFFLLYTDVFSLLLVLCAFLCLLRDRPLPAALLSLLSILIRQNNIVWAFLLWILFLFHNTGTLTTSSLTGWIRRTWAFPVLWIFFGVFVWWNGGISLGDRGAHPFPSFDPGNVWFLLFLFFFLFLPVHIENIDRMIGLVRRKPVTATVAAAVLFAVFMVTFVNDHPDNQADYWFFLRNRILVFSTASAYRKFLFFLPVLVSVLSLSSMKFLQNRFLLLYPVTILFLCSSWLIEQRYYLIPLSLFLLTRQHRDRIAEYALAAWWIAGSQILFDGILRGAYFL